MECGRSRFGESSRSYSALLGFVLVRGTAIAGIPLGSSQAARAIRTAALGTDCSASTGGLSTGWSSPALQEGLALGNVHLGACFPLRCFQRLSQPTIATRRCSWRNNRDTSG